MENSNPKLKNNQLKLIGFGSPIVDGVINYDSDPELCEQIKIRLKYHMSEKFPIEFYKGVFTSNHTSIFLGGSAMNTIRAANYILKSTCYKDTIGFVGSIRKDKWGELIINGLKEEGIDLIAQEFNSYDTSTSIVLVEQLDRIFFSDVGASDKITVEFFNSILDQISNSKIFYADAYLIGKNFDVFKFIFKNVNSDTLLSIGLACKNIVQDFFDNIIEILPYLDIIFANNEEINVLKEKFSKQVLTNIEFLIYLEQFLDNQNKKKKRIFVNTRGDEDTIIYFVDYQTKTSEVVHAPILKIDTNRIVDTNGAGDAFSGGFLAGVLLNLSLSESAYVGNKLASEVIQLKGFQIPKTKLFEQGFIFPVEN